MSDTPVEYRLPPLLMGEHAEEVLRELMEGKYKTEYAKLMGLYSVYYCLSLSERKPWAASYST